MFVNIDSVKFVFVLYNDMNSSFCHAWLQPSELMELLPTSFMLYF